jgi:hypothetical protein
MSKRRIVALMSVLVCLVSLAQGRISLFHLYDWNESPTGVVTVTAADPYYYGGWTVTLDPVADDGTLMAVNGLTLYDVAQPLVVDYRTGQVLLDATSEEPFATVTGSKTVVADGVTTQVDSVQRFYVVNEDWVTGGELQDVTGVVLADGTINIAGGFAYYIETERTMTITGRDGTSRTLTDETSDVSRIFRDLTLLVPNGKHEYTVEATGEKRTVDVCLQQHGDTVKVVNIYGYGAPAVEMVLNTDATVSYASQMLRDIPGAASPGGEGLWRNTNADGNVTATAITWGQTIPTDGVQNWPGWTDNKLYYTDGTEFVVPTAQIFDLGDVNHDGSVDVADVTLLINYILSGDDSSIFLSEANVDGDANASIDVGDVTALIAVILGN